MYFIRLFVYLLFISNNIIINMFHCLLICRFYRMVLCIYCSHVCSYPRQISKFHCSDNKGLSYLILSYLILYYVRSLTHSHAPYAHRHPDN